MDGRELLGHVKRLAAATILARHWPDQGSRHRASLALAGGLLRAGWTDDEATHFLLAVAMAAGDEEARARAGNVCTTARRLAAEQKATGWPTLVELLRDGSKVVEKARDWLGLRDDAGGAAGPSVSFGDGWGVRAGVPATDPPWPEPLAAEAMHGLAGEIVLAIEPHSEADPAALLAHFLAGTGALVGPRVHALAGDAVHPARLNAVVIGETSKSRKGSSARPNERVLKLADDSFVPDRVSEGLSSGEGLIWAVRDPISKYERVGRGDERHSELVEVDPGIMDKRLLVIESEFASTLRVLQREGNTLSAVIRRAWDSGDLRTMTKNNPATSTGAHISIVGHVTRDELLRYLDRSELASGFANRFLFFLCRRGRVLPDGEGVADAVLAPLAQELRAVREWAQTPRLLRRDDEASAIWHEVYPSLSEGKPGIFGAATNRAEAQVLRLSVLYAILDRSEAIRAEHLLAGLAVWKYCEQSARWIFGDAIGDPTADTILSALRRSGPLDREDLFRLFGRHVSSSRLDQALGLLMQLGLARVVKDSETGGRPREVWYAT